MSIRSVESAGRWFGAIVDRAAALGLERLERVSRRKAMKAPLCAVPLGAAADYLRLWDQAKAEAFPAVDECERACGAAIDPEWFHRLALLTQVVIKDSALCYQHGRVLYSILRRYLREQTADQLNIVETGTARGFSALCFSRALEDAGATGKIATFDVLPHDVSIYWNCLRDPEGPRTRAELLAEYGGLVEKYLIFHRGDTRRALLQVTFPRIHVAFLDSVHTYDHVMAECNAIVPCQRRGDLLIFDDYRAYAGVTRAADEVCVRHGYKGAVIVARPERAYLVAERQ